MRIDFVILEGKKKTDITISGVSHKNDVVVIVMADGRERKRIDIPEVTPGNAKVRMGYVVGREEGRYRENYMVKGVI